MILEAFTDTWNFTFLIAATISVIIGSFITIKKMKKEEFQKRHEKRLQNDESKDTETVDELIKKKKKKKN